MRAGRLGLADLLVRELRDHLEGAIGRRRADLAHDEALTLALEQLEIDHAAGLAIGRHEAVEMGPRMRMIVGALQVQHGRELHFLTALERRCRRALVHRLLGFPVGVVARQELVDRHRVWLPLGHDVLRVAVPAERIDDGRGHDHAPHGRIDRRRRRQGQRAIARIERPHRQQHRLVPTARVAHRAHHVGPATELDRPRFEPADTVVDVLERCGIGRRRGLPSVKRREDVRLLTGQGRYAEDVDAPGQAYAAFVRSPHAHAEVISLDAKPALAIAGTLGVFAGRDLVADGVGPIPTLIAERGGGIRSRDGSAFAEPLWYPLATDRVRHVGEPVAIVVAATPAAAWDAAPAVRGSYTEHPPVVDAVAALAAGAPRLHAGVVENRAYDWECGDPDATARAIAAAAHVTRLTLVDNRLVTCFLEPRAALAEWDGGTGRYTLHAGLQSVHQLAANLARVLGVAPERVRCVTGDVGGGFGSKIQVYPEYVALAWAARRLGRPVKWVSSRSEGFVSDVQSRDHLLRGELALDSTGRITALRVHSTSSLGAYVAPSIPISTLSNMERMISGLYAIPAIHLRVEGALTNTVPINVYRGVGRLECVYTVERLVERAARETGRDRVALRRANMVRTFPYRTATGAIYDSGDYVARLDEATERADTTGFAARRADSAKRGKLRGPGVGPYIEGPRVVPPEFPQGRVQPEGVIEVPIGAMAQGQGHETVFAQVVAERLGVPFETVRIVMGDTDRVAKGVGTFASRSMVRAGSAAAEASQHG